MAVGKKGEGVVPALREPLGEDTPLEVGLRVRVWVLAWEMDFGALCDPLPVLTGESVLAPVAVPERVPLMLPLSDLVKVEEWEELLEGVLVVDIKGEEDPLGEPEGERDLVGDTEVDTLVPLELEGKEVTDMDTEGVPLTEAPTDPAAGALPTPAKDTVLFTDTEVVLEMLGLGVEVELLVPLTVPVRLREVQVVEDRVGGEVRDLATLKDPPCDTDIVKVGECVVDGQGVEDLDPEGVPEAAGEVLPCELGEGDWE